MNPSPSPSPVPVPFSTDLSRVTTTLGVLAREAAGNMWLLRIADEEPDRAEFASSIILEWAHRTIKAALPNDETTPEAISVLLIVAADACRNWITTGPERDRVPPSPVHPLAPWTVSFELMADTMIRVVVDTANVAASTRPPGSVAARLTGLAAGSFARSTLRTVLGQFLTYHVDGDVPMVALDSYIYERSKVLEQELVSEQPTEEATREEETVTGYA